MIPALALLGWFIGLGPASPLATAQISTVHANARALGMGDAFSAVTRDRQALFYNPAGLSFIKTLRFTPTLLRAGASGRDAYAQVKDLKGNSSSDKFTAAIQKLYGRDVSVAGGVEAGLSGPNFALTGFDHLLALASVDNPVNPVLTLNAINDYGYAGGFGVPLSDELHFGVAGRYVRRSGTDTAFGASTLANLNPDEIQRYATHWGRGYAVDVGLAYVWSGRDAEVTAAGTWRNIGQTRYASSDPNTIIPFDDNDVTAGLGATFSVGSGVRLTPAVDVRYLNSAAYQLARKVNGGVELEVANLSLRGGFLGGYYTLGAGVAFDWLRLDAATYGVELGVYPGQREDRRVVAEASFAWDLEQTFRARTGRLKRRR